LCVWQCKKNILSLKVKTTDVSHVQNCTILVLPKWENMLYLLVCLYPCRVGPWSNVAACIKEPLNPNFSDQEGGWSVHKKRATFGCVVTPFCCESDTWRDNASDFGGWNIIPWWLCFLVYIFYSLWCVNLWFWLFVLLCSPWTKTLIAGIMWSSMKV
jgi:hypothetical protein